jgi:hypothetical protein
MHDPFRETDPRWQRPSTSIECELVENVRDYLQSPEAQGLVIRQRPPAPILPDGMRLQELGDGRYRLLYQDGSSGYRAIDGDRDELVNLAYQMVSE